MERNRRTIRVAVLFLLVAGVGRELPSFGQGVAPAEQTDLQKLQGTWICTKTIKDGQSVQTYVGVKATIKGDRLTWYFPKPDGTFAVSECGFSIDPKQNPKFFDWHYAASPDKPFYRLYRFDGDVLWMADNNNGTGRPKSFEEAVWNFECKRVTE